MGVWAKGGCDVSLWGKTGRFYRHTYACGGFVSTKESCDFGESDILSRLSGWGLVLA